VFTARYALNPYIKQIRLVFKRGNECNIYRLEVFDKRVLREILGSKTEELTRRCRKLHKVDPHNLYLSPNINRVLRSRKMSLAGHVAHTVRREMRAGLEFRSVWL
jgi:hypothetical protein